MAEYFLMQMLYSSSSSVRLISDIFVSIGCSSTLLKQFTAIFLLLSLISSLLKKPVESQLYLNYFVSVAILEVYILH